ncbi:MAG: hypothetical protein ACI4F1_03145, partial [Bariatricus sp.]
FNIDGSDEREYNVTEDSTLQRRIGYPGMDIRCFLSGRSPGKKMRRLSNSVTEKIPASFY